MNLSTYIHMQLQEKGAMPFHVFMQHALYHPLYGYYSAGLIKFGEEGDFITAPELTPLFGKTLANQVQQVLSQLTNPIVFEFGAGSGRLCVDILTELKALDCLPSAYFILEVSADLKHRQQTLIQQEIPDLAPLVTWLSAWPDEAFQGVIIANEVLDAMPVHRFLYKEGQYFEAVITEESPEALIERFEPCKDPLLQAYLDRLSLTLPDPYLSEANLFMEGWMQECARMLSHGAMICLDYGFPRHEYYHPDRQQGTLMCHYRHHAHTNPLVYVGEQDITAHVDFTHLAEAADLAGFHVAGFTNQAAFLMNNGLLTLLQESDSMHALQAVKKLIQPNEMGELFKVMALTKGMDIDLTGFQSHDKRASL